MMQRCTTHHNMVGPCPCGLFHHTQPPNTTTTTTTSMFFSMPNHHYNNINNCQIQSSFDHEFHHDSDSNDTYHFTPSPSSVDCTLSLGTPSTHRSYTEPDVKKSDSRTGFLWGTFQKKKATSNNNNNNNYAGLQSFNHKSSNKSDPLLARRCANCDTTSTPLWRNGPRGPKSLCNACGIRFKKEERKANANNNNNASASTTTMDHNQCYYYNHGQNNSWVLQTQKAQCYSPHDEFRFIEDSSGHHDSNFRSWRLNFADRPSLVHDFTR